MSDERKPKIKTDLLVLPKVRSRVLVVDDEPAILDLYRLWLERSEFAVHCAANAEEALAALGTGSVDAIVSDIQMPGMSGLELLEEVQRRGLAAPVILVTGVPSLDSALQAMEHGALRYLRKPIDFEELIKIVTQAVHLNRLGAVQAEALELLKSARAEEAEKEGLDTRFRQVLDSVWLALQPIVSASEHRIVAWECLVRSDEPLSTGAFQILDLAHRVGEIQALSRQLRIRAAAIVERLPPGTSIHVNICPQDLLDPDLLDPASPLSRLASRVVLEVTENESLDRVPAIGDKTTALRELGYRIAIDDLGAGYAGLSSFAELRPDLAKLDMALVRGVDRDPTRARLAGTLLELCASMGIELVAEGVETEAERDTLLELGCDLFQGYLFARPSPHLVVTDEPLERLPSVAPVP